MKNITIGNKFVGLNEPVFIIAEAGINHNGEVAKAKMLVKAAADAGADAIKFQTHMPDKEMLNLDVTAGYVGESFYDLLERTKLSEDNHIELKRMAEELGLIFLSTPFSREAADFLEEIGIVAFKTGSGELTNIPLLKHIANKVRPMIISTGMSDLEEVKETVNTLKEINDEIVVMQCTSTYPTSYTDVNLKVISRLMEEFNSPAGLSDHSIGIYTAIGAVALGAVALEKHFTIDRNWVGPDQKASIEPQELRELVKGARAVKQALGERKAIIDKEIPVIKMARESVVSLMEIPKGTVINNKMVWVKRPGTGIAARDLYKVIGKRARRNIKGNNLILWDDLELL